MEKTSKDRWFENRHDNDTRERFVEELDTYSDLIKYGDRLRKDQYDFNSLIKAGELAHPEVDDPQSFYSNQGASGPINAIRDLELSATHKQPEIAKYVERNIEYFIDGVNGETLEGLILQGAVKLFKPKNASNDYLELRESVHDFQEASSEDPKVRSNYIRRKMSESPQINQIMLRFSGKTPGYSDVIFESYINDAKARLGEKLNEMDEAELKDALRTSIDAIREIYDDAEGREKTNIWYGNLMPVYMILASSNFEKEEEIVDSSKKNVRDLHKERIKRSLKEAGGRRESLTEEQKLVV